MNKPVPQIKQVSSRVIPLFKPDGKLNGSQGQGLINICPLRVTTEDHLRLKRAARMRGVSMAEIIRTYVEWGLDADGEE